MGNASNFGKTSGYGTISWRTFPNLFLISRKKERTIESCWDAEQDLGFRRGLFDREISNWMGLINQIDNTIQLGSLKDDMLWNIDALGSFTTKSTFVKLLKPKQVINFPQYLKKIEIFLWSLAYRGINTHDRL